VNSVHNPAYDPGLQARFALAARHSRLVRILRVAVPAAVGLAMAMVVGISLFNPFHMEIKTDNLSGNLVVSGRKITMETPHLTGFTPDQRPYDLVAKTATQDLTDPDHVELNTVRAKVLMQDGSTTTLDALTGLFDTKQQQIDLYKDILLTTSTGYQARLNSAHADMAKGTVSSDEHVDVKLTNGTLTADRLRITDNGDVVRFEGNVVMNLNNLDGGSPAPAQTEAAADPAPQPQRTRRSKTSNAK
jgi:lipopolysaccharide export system protein LptC